MSRRKGVAVSVSESEEASLVSLSLSSTTTTVSPASSQFWIRARMALPHTPTLCSNIVSATAAAAADILVATMRSSFKSLSATRVLTVGLTFCTSLRRFCEWLRSRRMQSTQREQLLMQPLRLTRFTTSSSAFASRMLSRRAALRAASLWVLRGAPL